MSLSAVHSRCAGDVWFLWPDLEGRSSRSTLSATFHKDGLQHSLRSTQSSVVGLSVEELPPSINSAFEFETVSHYAVSTNHLPSALLTHPMDITWPDSYPQVTDKETA